MKFSLMQKQDLEILHQTLLDLQELAYDLTTEDGVKLVRRSGKDLPDWFAQEYGICFSTARLVGGDGDTDRQDWAEDWLRSAFSKWPEFSGEVDYPIATDPWRPSGSQYNLSSPVEMWAAGDYAAARLRLLDFLVHQARTELAALA